MTSEWIHTRADFARLAPAWDAALRTSGSDNPFLLADFLLTWCEAFVPEGDLRILAVFDRGALVGGLPLYAARRRRAGVSWPMLRAVGLGFANLSEPFHTVPREVFGRLCLEALRALPGWWYLNLPLSRTPWLPQAEATADAMPRLTRATATTARIRIDGEAAAYVRTLRPKMQANLRRCLRLAAAAGAVSLRRETDPAAVAELIRFQLRHNGPDRYPPDTVVTPSRAAWTAFTARLLDLLARHGRLDAMSLRIGDEVAAAGFGFRYGPGYKSILTSYDPRFRHLGPGFVLFYHLIGWCWRNHDPYLDMYGDGGELDKRRWCNQFEPLYTLRLFSPGAAGRALYVACRLWRF